MIPDSLFICSFRRVVIKMSSLNIKWKNKKFISRVIAVLVLILGITILSQILQIKSDHGINQNRGLYFQPEDSIDAVFLGTSHIHCDVNTALLWENYGIAAYDYSGAEQPLWMTYYYLREFYKYQDPKVVVLDLYAPARFKDDYQYTWISENIYGMKFSFNKLAMLCTSVEPDKFFDYFPSFAIYHGRYDELEQEDFTSLFWSEDQLQSFKGYTPYWKHVKKEEVQNPTGVSGGLTAKSEKYLRKIMDYMKEKDAKLILIVAPYAVAPEDEETYQQIKTVADEYGVELIDYNQKMELDVEEDLNDLSHLNYWGSCKFTEILGEDLLQRVNLPDHRGDVAYQSWEEHVERIKEEVNYEIEHLEKKE